MSVLYIQTRQTSFHDHILLIKSKIHFHRSVSGDETTESVPNLQVDVVSGVSVCLLGAPHGVHVLVVVCPVVVRAGGPVVTVREAVSVPAPEKRTTVINKNTDSRDIHIR